MLPLLLTLCAAPPPSVRLPAEVRAAPGRLVTLTAESSGPHVRWALASDGADLVPFPNGTSAVFAAPKPGRYLVLVWTAAGDVPSEAARCWVAVGDGTPGPTDPLAADVQKLFDADTSANKGEHLAQLAAVYREAVRFADRAEVRTAGDLAGRIKAAANSLLPGDALVGVRKRVADEVARSLPADPDAPLDAATRAAAGKLFDRIAGALEGVK